MNFVEIALEELRLAHERLRAEHMTLLEISEQGMDALAGLTDHRTHLERLRAHKARLQAHRAALRAI